MQTLEDVESFSNTIFIYWIVLSFLCVIGKVFWIWLGKRPDETLSQAIGWNDEAICYWICLFFCFTGVIALLFFQIILFLKTGTWCPSALGYVFTISVDRSISHAASQIDLPEWKGLVKIIYFFIYKIPLYVPLIFSMGLFFRLAIIAENKPKWPS